MVDDDRQNILEYIINSKENNHELMKTSNQQIQINDDLQNSDGTLKQSLLDNREQKTNTINSIKKNRTTL